MTWLWPSSETTGEVIAAFVAALQTVDDVTKDRKVDMGAGKANYTYADLAATHDTVKPVLAANGLAMTQAASSDGVHTVLLHSSGEWLAFPALKVQTGQSTPQAQGSALTYARRYSLLAALNIATEDDDGQAAAQAPRSTPIASQNQLSTLGALLRGRVGQDRDAGLALIAEHVGRTVASSKELTVAEASQLINALQALAEAEEAPDA